MTTDTDPRVADLPPLPRHGVFAPPRPHYEPMPLYTASQMREYALAAIAKVPCIASDPRCPCNDGDTCNYVATTKTPAFEVPHPDAAQLISIADLLPTLSGADPAMLANVGHYLRGLSDRVKVLPVARTGPLRVAAEAVSAPVEAVPTYVCNKCGYCGATGPHDRPGTSTRCNYYAGLKVATTPPQAEPSIEQQLQNAREDFTAMKALTESGATEIARLTAELAQANAMCESLAASVQDLANAKAAVDEAHAIELADEKAVVDCLKSELADRLQKQRAAEAELQEARKDSARYRWLREQAWFVGPLCVLRDPKAVLTRGAFLGADCPSLSRLDDAIDAAMTKAKP